MTTATLRPDGTVTAADSVTSAASTHAATNDDSDSSYVVEAGVFEVDLGTVSMASGSVTKQARLRYRGRGDSTSGSVSVQLLNSASGVASLNALLTTTIATKTGAYTPVTLTQAEVNALTLTVSNVFFADDGVVRRPRVRRASFDVGDGRY